MARRLDLAMVTTTDEVVRGLREAGLLDVPERFGIASVHQEIAQSTIAEIDAFIRVFDRVTSRDAWEREATARGPATGHSKGRETCFFSAWDFHVPPGRPEGWQLIEFNDNGSGMVFAALLNHHHYLQSGLDRFPRLEPPRSPSSFSDLLVGMIRAEAESFFGAPLLDSVLVLDDAESLETGRFRHELRYFRDLCRAAGWRAELAAPEDTAWDDNRLLCRGEPVGFVVNRSTDFFWERESFSALRAAYANRTVYMAPNPFTYATRSDKRLLEWLSTPVRDVDLGIEPGEREILGAHVPETRVVREENVDELARCSSDWFFKPSHGFASHGLLPGAEVGRSRLRRLLKKGHSYVAQRSVPKPRLETGEGTSLWVDLRVWAYRGKRFLLSGRASRKPDRLDLSPPGGWVPTYVSSEPPDGGSTAG
jgi:hypothetical protein